MDGAEKPIEGQKTQAVIKSGNESDITNKETQQGIMEIISTADILSERAWEEQQISGGSGDGQTSGGTQKKDDQKISSSGSAGLPANEEMVDQIMRRLHMEMSKALNIAGRYEKGINHGMAYDFAKSVSEVRTLKRTISKLVSAGVEYIKNLYLQMFGKKK